MDGRKNNGAPIGGNPGAGRKPKAEEQQLIEKLTPLEPLAFDALKNAIADEQSWAVKLFFDYKYGKPKETKDISINSFDVIDMSTWK